MKSTNRSNRYRFEKVQQEFKIYGVPFKRTEYKFYGILSTQPIVKIEFKTLSKAMDWLKNQKSKHIKFKLR